jgi:hypothetical protein
MSTRTRLCAPGLKKIGAVSVAAVTILAPLLVGSATIASAATSNTAKASCTVTSANESTPFARWIDLSQYFLAPNGGFANGSTSWTLNGNASLVTGNSEPWNVAGPSDTSLELGAGATAQTAPLCVDMDEPTVRLFVDAPTTLGSLLQVQATTVNPANGATASTVLDVIANPILHGWGPTLPLILPNLLEGTGTEELTLSFSETGFSAPWYIDDVYVDPFQSR